SISIFVCIILLVLVMSCFGQHYILISQLYYIKNKACTRFRPNDETSNFIIFATCSQHVYAQPTR
ncbi:hypothetical protein ACJX0J_009891, partial [Zea mays]